MKITLDVPAGSTGEFVMVVTPQVTVAHFHPEMPAVLGTPFLIYAMEVAASEAMKPHLPEGWASVGAEVNVKHLAATPVGGTVTARATVVGSEATLVRFAIEARDEHGLIGEGTHVRAAVELSRFYSRMEKRTGANPLS